jgi:low affinity Fe/Cu permease
VSNGSIQPRNRYGARQANVAQPGHSAHSQSTPEQTAHFLEARKQVAQTNTVNLWFSRVASRTAQLVGHPYMFLAAVVVLVAWAVSGPFFHFSDTWQLIINTGTTIITFLVVFLIQNTQNRDAKAVHLKLDDVIRALKGARNELIDLENPSDEDLTRLEKQFEGVRKKAERNGNNPRGMVRANRTERASKGKGI